MSPHHIVAVRAVRLIGVPESAECRATDIPLRACAHGKTLVPVLVLKARDVSILLCSLMLTPDYDDSLPQSTTMPI